ncbi:hypothetical protein [Flavobacterium pallidum]|uniref:DUF4136 domain-containing protein n=1 Tax=Flavobacterium pallidum TaxID=2172098 RepID=A0A2S1SKY8_9FLAO|nr:hypothetical protein [Flavobacterium pallidum]AWI27041.1 hypothetical protein HYN49_14640 [Flavobacterium pallidum]
MQIKIFLLFTALFTSLAINAQQLYKCDDTQSFWAFSKDEPYQYVKLSGFAKETERKSMISVGDYVLQNVIADKSKHMENGAAEDLKILVRYALSEAEYLSGIFGKWIDIKMEKPLLSNGMEALLWWFELPMMPDNQVKSQLFVNVISGDKIFGLSSSQFEGQEFEDVKKFLIAVIGSLKRVTDARDFEKLCSK